MIAAPALAGVWVAQSSYGPTCYLVKFNVTDGYYTYSNTQLIGTGVVSGSNFTGFLKMTPNPISANSATNPFAVTYNLKQCGANSECVWAQATWTQTNNYWGSGAPKGVSIVSVTNLPIISAQPTACW